MYCLWDNNCTDADVSLRDRFWPLSPVDMLLGFHLDFSGIMLPSSQSFLEKLDKAEAENTDVYFLYISCAL